MACAAGCRAMGENKVQENTPQLCKLSMGMSGDFELAIEEGATIIRVSQAIFGKRATSDQYYWPEKTAQEPGSMKTAIVIRHVLFEDLGLLAPLLQEQNFAVRYLEAGLDDLSPARQADLLIILGGPIGAFDEDKYPFILDELAVIKHRLSLKQATLGICLGAQLMARALGAAVAPMQQQEISFAPLTLTAAGEKSPLLTLQNQPVLHWHGDQFAIPQGATLLAASAQCPHQAFSLDNYALALQFHAEADCQRIEQWLIGHAAELAMAGAEPGLLRKQAAENGAALSSACRLLFTQWLNLLPQNRFHNE